MSSANVIPCDQNDNWAKSRTRFRADSMTSKTKEIPTDEIEMSLIICSRNGGEKLARVLETICAHEMHQPKAELVLVNSVYG